MLAQKNFVKFKAFALPAAYQIGNITIGYERFVSDKISLQITSSGIILDFSRYDGSNRRGIVTVPELRYYLKPSEKEVKRSFYVALFGRYAYFSVIPGEEGVNYNVFDAFERQWEGGVLAGKNFRLSNRFTFDCFIGPRINHFQYTEKNDENGAIAYKSYRERNYGVRVGFNLGFGF